MHLASENYEALVNIVVVNLNGKDYLRRCFRSIEEQTSSVSYQITVVDNGSTDDSVAWIRNEHPKVLIIQNKENRGFAAACNQGIENSCSDYILLLNNDTMFRNNVLKTLVDFFESESRVGLTGPLTVYPDGAIQASIKNFLSIRRFVIHHLGISALLRRGNHLYYPYGPFQKGEYDHTHQVDWLSGSCLMFRRSLFDEIGPLDENMPFGVEDMDYARRAVAAGYKNYFVSEAKIVHWKKGSHGSNNRSQDAFVYSAYRQGISFYLHKHHNLIQRSLARLSMKFSVMLMGIGKGIARKE